MDALITVTVFFVIVYHGPSETQFDAQTHIHPLLRARGGLDATGRATTAAAAATAVCFVCVLTSLR